MPSVVDLFCGIGGLTHGFVKEGFRVLAGIDADETCRYAYERNNGTKFICKSVEDVTADEIAGLYPEGDLRILVGCAPCQPFSRYTKARGRYEKWGLLDTFCALIRAVRPVLVSMENVPDLARYPVFGDFVNTLLDEGFHVSWSLVNCADYGVPQTRVRLVLFASRLGEIRIIPKTHSARRYRTVRQAIGCLEPLAAGEGSRRDRLHRCSALSDLNRRRIAATPTGGSWRDWEDDLVLECHKRDTGKTYPSVYGRMLWDELAPTVTTQCNGLGNGRFGHPEQDRAVSLREAALLQTFPRRYRFVAPKNPIVMKHVARHIGNAVPVRLGQVVARTIKKHLEAHLDH